MKPNMWLIYWEKNCLWVCRRVTSHPPTPLPTLSLLYIYFIKAGLEIAYALYLLLIHGGDRTDMQNQKKNQLFFIQVSLFTRFLL